MDVNVEVEVTFNCLWYLCWQAALTPDGAMIPPDDIFGEISNTDARQDQQCATNLLSECTSALLLEGLEEFGR